MVLTVKNLCNDTFCPFAWLHLVCLLFSMTYFLFWNCLCISPLGEVGKQGTICSSCPEFPRHSGPLCGNSTGDVKKRSLLLPTLTLSRRLVGWPTMRLPRPKRGNGRVQWCGTVCPTGSSFPCCRLNASQCPNRMKRDDIAETCLLRWLQSIFTTYRCDCCKLELSLLLQTWFDWSQVSL